MSQCTAYYYVDGKLLDSAVIESPFSPLQSHAFLCADCGKQWASIPVITPEGRMSGWLFHVVPCYGHKYQTCLDVLTIPGSLVQSILPQPCWGDYPVNLHQLPREVLRREFEIHMQHILTEASASQTQGVLP